MLWCEIPIAETLKPQQVCQGTTSGPTLSIFINDLNVWTKCTLIKFVDGTTLLLRHWLSVLPFKGSWIGCSIRLKRIMWYSTRRNAKSCVCQGMTPQYIMTGWGEALQRGIWVLQDKKLTTSQHCAFTAEEVNDLQSRVRQGIDSRSAEEFPLLYSVLVRYIWSSGLTGMRQEATAAGAVKGHKNNKGRG